MANRHIIGLHWKLFFPLVGLSWLIIGITIAYFVAHEEQRLKENLGNRLINVNSTVIEAYRKGADLQNTVEFIKLFTNRTTLDPLRITVYDSNGTMVADNAEATIHIYDGNGNIIPELKGLWNNPDEISTHDIELDGAKFMISSKSSPDGLIHSFAALPYKGEVHEFLSVDPMIWIVVIALGIISSLLAYLGSRALSRNIYALRDFANAISSDKMPDSIDLKYFSKDELGEVSIKLLSLYRDKLNAEHEKLHHEQQIAMNVSHELNTPVGIIKGYLDTILADQNMPEETKRKFLMRVQQNTNRLATLVNDINMVMRLQDNGSGIELTRINFHDIAAKLCDDIKAGQISKNIKFEFDVPDPCYVIAHESLIMNAMLNLINNSVKHSDGTIITLRYIREENGRAFFSFSDNGIGVEEEHLNRLFDLFYRVDTGRARKNGGSGLGLPLVKRVISAMNGEITVRNQETGGLEFIFSLPTTKKSA